MANAVKFWRGSRDAFNGISTKSADTLYFITSGVGANTLYKGSSLQGTQVVVVTEYPQTPIQGILYKNSATGEIKYHDGSSWVVILPAIVTTLTDGGTGIPTAGTVYTAIDELNTAINNLTSEIGGTIHVPVQNLTALAAISDSELQDKLLCFVEDKGTLYRYDADSTAEASGDDIVAPAGGTGRWFSLFTALNVNGTAPIVTNGRDISLTINSHTLEVANSALKVKFNAADFTSDSDGLALKDVQRKVTGSHTDEVVTLDSNGYVQASGYSIANTAFVDGESDSDVLVTKRDLAAAIQIALGKVPEQVQTDYLESDSTSPAYLVNKAAITLVWEEPV